MLQIVYRRWERPASPDRPVSPGGEPSNQNADAAYESVDEFRSEGDRHGMQDVDSIEMPACLFEQVFHLTWVNAEEVGALHDRSPVRHQL